MGFRDRQEAGRWLAEALEKYRGGDAIVLGLPRGGVPVAYEVATAIGLPLDLMLVRKLGVPGHEELAMGAIANRDVTVMNDSVVSSLTVSREAVDQAIERERKELERRNELYRDGVEPPKLEGRTVILVDDGIATGADMRAAAQAAQKQSAHRVVVAVPVAPEDTVDSLGTLVDELVVLETPEPFFGVGAHYQDFSQTTDEEVTRCLAAARAEEHPQS
jgi:predicted phosphoribosyltransferase